MTTVYVMYYFFYAELLLPSVIRSYLLKWRPNDKAQPSAKMFLKNSCGVVFIYVKQWLYIWRHVIVLLQAELGWSSRESSKMCPPDSLFPSYRSHAYKPPLRIITQITLPTPARMKTKSRRRNHSSVPRWPSHWSLPQETVSPSWLQCCM